MDYIWEDQVIRDDTGQVVVVLESPQPSPTPSPQVGPQVVEDTNSDSGEDEVDPLSLDSPNALPVVNEEEPEAVEPAEANFQEEPASASLGLTNDAFTNPSDDSGTTESEDGDHFPCLAMEVDSGCLTELETGYLFSSPAVSPAASSSTDTPPPPSLPSSRIPSSPFLPFSQFVSFEEDVYTLPPSLSSPIRSAEQASQCAGSTSQCLPAAAQSIHDAPPEPYDDWDVEYVNSESYLNQIALERDSAGLDQNLSAGGSSEACKAGQTIGTENKEFEDDIHQNVAENDTKLSNTSTTKTASTKKAAIPANSIKFYFSKVQETKRKREEEPIIKTTSKDVRKQKIDTEDLHSMPTFSAKEASSSNSSTSFLSSSVSSSCSPFSSSISGSSTPPSEAASASITSSFNCQYPTASNAAPALAVPVKKGKKKARNQDNPEMSDEEIEDLAIPESDASFHDPTPTIATTSEFGPTSILAAEDSDSESDSEPDDAIELFEGGSEQSQNSWTLSQLLQIEEEFKHYFEKHDEDEALSCTIPPNTHKSITTSRLHIRVARWSSIQNKTSKEWSEWIATEEERFLQFMKKIDSTVSASDLRIIIMQKSALCNIADLPRCVKSAEMSVPHSSRPARLVELRGEDRIASLTISSADGFLAVEASLLRFLLGIFPLSSSATWPTFFLHVQVPQTDLWKSHDGNILAKTLLGLAKATVDIDALRRDMASARLKRYLMALSTRCDSAGRNSGNASIQGKLQISAIEAPGLLARLYELSGITPTPVLPLSALHALETVPQAITWKSSFAVSRFSHWVHQFTARGDDQASRAFIKSQQKGAFQSMGSSPGASDDWTFFAWGQSGLGEAANISDKDCFPPGAASSFITSVQAGSIKSIWIPSPDSLLVYPSQLQLLLLGCVRDNTVPHRVEFIINLCGPSHAFRSISSWKLAQSLSMSDQDIDEDCLYFVQWLREAQISRLAKIVAAQFGGAGGRNRQSERIYPIAPKSAYTESRNSAGQLIYVCTHNSCDYFTRRQNSRDRHWATHNPIKAFKCTFPGCERDFSENGALKRHAEVHKPVSEIFKCLLCPKQYLSKQSLQRHQKTCGKPSISIKADNPASRVVCELCKANGINKDYASKHSLQNHMRDDHGISKAQRPRNIKDLQKS